MHYPIHSCLSTTSCFCSQPAQLTCYYKTCVKNGVRCYKTLKSKTTICRNTTKIHPVCMANHLWSHLLFYDFSRAKCSYFNTPCNQGFCEFWRICNSSKFDGKSVESCLVWKWKFCATLSEKKVQSCLWGSTKGQKLKGTSLYIFDPKLHILFSTLVL